MIKEVCLENFTNLPAMIARGANRIELCDNLAVGGTTPSTGVIEEAVAYAHEQQVSVMVMIRPRGGDFIYNDTELKIMHTDLIEAKKIGSDGVVFGCLTKSGWLDEEVLELLIDTAEGLQITFHMAFDLLSPSNQLKAIDWLVDHGVQRILTHGGALDVPIENNLTHLKTLINYANQRLIILPGGGISTKNLSLITKELAVNEIHGTAIV